MTKNPITMRLLSTVEMGINQVRTLILVFQDIYLLVHYISICKILLTYCSKPCGHLSSAKNRIVLYSASNFVIAKTCSNATLPSNKCGKSDGLRKVANYAALSLGVVILNTLVLSANLMWRWGTCNASSISRESSIISKCGTVSVVSHRAGFRKGSL